MNCVVCAAKSDMPICDGCKKGIDLQSWLVKSRQANCYHDVNYYYLHATCGRCGLLYESRESKRIVNTLGQPR
jgi:hypothetical protein